MENSLEPTLPAELVSKPGFNVIEFAGASSARITLAQNDREALASWLMQYRDNPNTYESFKREGLRFILWAEYHQLTLKQLTVEHISSYWNFLANPEPRAYWCSTQTPKYDESRKRTAGWVAPKPAPIGDPEWRPFVSDLGPTAIRHTQSVIFLWFEYLANIGYLASNVLRSVRRRRARVKAAVVDRHMPTEAFRAVIAYIDELPLDSPKDGLQAARARFVFLFLCLTGLRRFELASATTDDIVTDGDGWWLKVLGKGDKDAEVPLPDEAVAAFKTYREALGRPALPASPEPLVMDAFGAGRGMSSESIYHIVKTLMAGAADRVEGSDPRMARTIKKVSPHWLRHTSATQQLQAGVPLTVVQTNMRHSDISTTRQYLHDERRDRHKATKGFSLLDSSKEKSD